MQRAVGMCETVREALNSSMSIMSGMRPWRMKESGIEAEGSERGVKEYGNEKEASCGN